MAMPTAPGVAKIIVLKSSMCKFHFKPDKASEKHAGTSHPSTTGTTGTMLPSPRRNLPYGKNLCKRCHTDRLGKQAVNSNNRTSITANRQQKP